MSATVDKLIMTAEITKFARISPESWKSLLSELDKRYLRYSVINPGEIKFMGMRVVKGFNYGNEGKQ